MKPSALPERYKATLRDNWPVSLETLLELLEDALDVSDANARVSLLEELMSPSVVFTDRGRAVAADKGREALMAANAVMERVRAQRGKR